MSPLDQVHSTADTAVKPLPVARRGTSSFWPVVGIAILPAVYVLTTYLDQGVWLFEASRAVAVAGMTSVVAIGVPTLILRDRVPGALVGLCLLAMLFAYRFPGVLVLLGIVSALIAVGSILGSRSPAAGTKLLRLAYRLLGVFGFALLGVVLLQFAIRGQVLGYSPPAAVAEADPAAPDIWLVLLDGHPRADVLERYWGFDGPGLADELEGLGFRVADGAQSNYNMTKLTLPALFNMALLSDLEPWSGYKRPVDAPAPEHVRALQNNRSFALLREHGYHLTSIGAGYTQEDVRAVDQFVDAGTADVVELHLLGATALGEALQVLDPQWGEHQAGQRAEANLATLTRLAAEGGDQPRFVFAHIPSPHMPLAFATVDRPTVPLADVFSYPRDLFGDDLFRQAYREQVEGLDERVLDAMTTIVNDVGDESVIIVMSDHGSRTNGGLGTLSAEDVDEQFSILLAARVPGGDALFGPNAMATDVLSTVANRYLGTDIPPVARVFESWNGSRYPQ